MSASGAIANIQAALNSWLALEHRPLLTVDGVYGAKTDEAFELLAQAAKSEHDGGAPVASPPPEVPPTHPLGDLPADPRSETNIATLHPRVQPLARALVHNAAAQGITIKVTSGTRTYAEQDALYEQGRSHSGSIVTNARGGQSNHNFGVAFDVTIFNGASPVWDSPQYRTIGQLGKALGLSWGGDWASIQDEPHFELRPDWAKDEGEGAMLAGLRSRHDSGKDAFA